MPATISAERQVVIQEANSRLENWLDHVTDIQVELQELAEDGNSVYFQNPRRGGSDSGLGLAFGGLPIRTSIAVIPSNETELSGKKYRDGALTENGRTYSSAVPFAGGVMLHADFYTREQTEEGEYIGFNLLCAQAAHPAYPNDYSPDFYLADAVVVSDELLPQVAVAVTHTPRPIHTVGNP